jgi:DNA-binding HxlR family transcriptional regulator
VAGILGLIGNGASGQVLMALGPGALRTQQLTDRVPRFSVRSVYRGVNEMRGYALIDRQEEPGVPSTVVLSLTDPAGRNLFRLLRAFAATSMAELPGDGREARSWASLNLLGELWGLGFAEELSHGSRSLTEFAGGSHELTYHQVGRRIGLFVAGGLLIASPPKGQGKRYELTDHGRRRMALVTGVGRWRRRHVTDGGPGLTIAEMATVLRTALPLTLFPQYAGMSIDLAVTGAVDHNGLKTTETLQGTIGRDGAMHCDQLLRPVANGSATATTNIWFGALLEGNLGRMRVRGNLGFVDACLTQLHEMLWEKAA